MKKKNILVLGLFITLLGSIVYASTITKFSRGFVKHFKDCDAYQEIVNSNFEDTDFTTKRNIVGWKNGYCRYEEVITSSQNEKFQMTCSFPDLQVEELYKAMTSKNKEPQKYDLEIFDTQTTKNGQVKHVVAGNVTIKGNLAYIAWAKYQNNPYFCSIEKK